jgi:hypothetical protein
MGGRQYELWQPILALASFVDFSRPNGSGIPLLHPRVLAYAKKLCESGSETQLPEEDFHLLRALTDKVVRGKHPTCKEILDLARQIDAEALRGMSARKAAEILKRYGLTSSPYGGKHVFREVLEHLKAIEIRYAVDLNTAGKDGILVVKGSWY